MAKVALDCAATPSEEAIYQGKGFDAVFRVVLKIRAVYRLNALVRAGS